MIRKKKGKTDTQQHVLNHFIKIDSFQDPQIDSHGKTSQIDSFQDPHIVHYFGLISRPLHFTTKPDSCQDPQQWTVSNTTQFSHFKTLTSDFNSVLFSMGNYLHMDNAKSP